jgi:PAS domain S-box-containing protein
MSAQPRFHRLLEAVHDGILVYDLTPRLIFAGPKYLSLVGYDADEVLVQGAQARVLEEDRAPMDQVFQAILAAPDQIRSVRYRAQTKDGRTLHLDGRASLQSSGVEGISSEPCILLCISDRSAEVEAQEALARKESFQSALLENLHDGVLLMDLQQKVLYASPQYLSLLGYGSDELAAQEGMRRVHPDDRGQLSAVFQQTLAAPGKLFEARYRAQTKAGALVHLHVRGRAHLQGIPGLSEQPCVLVSIRDVSAEVQTRRELEEREAFLRALVGSLNDGILILNMDQIPIYVSEVYASFLGTTPEAMLGQPVPERVFAEDLPRIRQNFRDAVAGGLPQAVHYRLKGPKGPIHQKGYCRYLPQGFPGFAQPCVVVVARDAADEVAAQERLVSSERFHRGVLERFDDVVVVLDAEGHFNYVSPSVERLLGYTPEQLLGRDGFELLLPEERRAMQDTFRRAMDTPSDGRESEFRLRDAFGKVRILAAVSSPAGPELGGALLVRFRDVTKARLSDEELLRSERLTLISELLAGVSHELRNPLLAVSANAELLASSAALDADDRESAEAIQAQVRRLRTLLDEAMNAPLEPPARRLAPQALLDQALLQARRRFGPSSAKVSCDVHVEPACAELLAVPGRLQLALANVALNAFQALPEVGGALSLSAAPDHGGILISLIDNGPGVPGGSMNELFDPFYTTRPTASGLGLSTAKRIVEAHQGRLWALPAEPHGLAVHAWLPAAP